MKKLGVLTAVLVSLAFLAAVAVYIMAASFSSSVSPVTISSANSNAQLNVTVSNSGSDNITQVNITLPARFTFVPNSNSTTVTNFTFNSSFGSNLTWTNTTAVGIVQNNSVSQGFWFNVSVPRTIGNFTINVSTLDFSGTYNITNISVFVDADVWSSGNGILNQSRQFGLIPGTLRLNWTNNFRDNITVFANASFNNLTIEVANSTSGLGENYTQGNSQSSCQVSGNFLKIRNATSFGNFVGLLNASNDANATLIFDNLLCKPGRYSTTTYIARNSSITNETANITVIVELPLSTENTLSESTGIGSFAGSLPTNATTYQSYYFDTSNITNATSVVINMSGWSSGQELDVFLFDNSSTPLLQAKSINKTATNEYLIFNYLPTTGKMWDIRVYGNSTSSISYNGNILFSGLNATNTSTTNHSQQFSLIDFGIKNASIVTNLNITVRNEANITYTNVTEEMEVYRVVRLGGNGTMNFTVVVPDSSIANKVAVGLNWTGMSNYSYKVVNSAENVLIESPVNGSYRLANVTGANQELWNETTSVGSAVDVWTIQVLNHTNTSTDPYNVTVFTYVTTSTWLASNYSTMTFNRTWGINATTDAAINFTVPNNTLDGIYEGTIKYRDVNRAGISVPLKVNVTAPVLLVNGTMSSKTFRIDEDIGANITRDLFFMLNNTGSVDATVTILNSSTNLTCSSGGCSGYNGSLSLNTTTSISKLGSQMIRVQVSFNSSMPTGVYEGWVYVNASNNTVAFAAHPYSTFNATIRLNLTSNITFEMLEVKSELGNLVTRNTSAENVTIRFKVNYVNGTDLGPEVGTRFNVSNFSVWLVSKNFSSFRVPTTGSLVLLNGTNPIYNVVPTCTNSYCINATIPTNTTGGFYELHISGNYTKNPTYTGEGVNTTLVVNNSGLLMSTNVTGCSFGSSCTTSISMSNSSTTTVQVNASNFGNVAASSVTLTYSESCTGYSLSSPTATSACSAGTLSGGTATVSPGANTTTCIVSWTVTANTSSASACTGTLSGSPSNRWYNPNGINISITVTQPSGSGDGTSGGSTGGGTATTTTTTTTGAPPVYLEFSSYPSTVSVEQGNTTESTVVVNNTNSTVGQTLDFSIDGINSSWYSINSTAQAKFAPLTTLGYKITFTVPKEAEVKDHAGTFKAKSNYTELTQGFVLKVTPGAELQQDISQDLSIWEAKITDLEKEINATIKKGWNTTVLEAKLADLKSKFLQAKSYQESGDYREAFDLLSSIDTLYNETSQELANLKKEHGRSLWDYIKIAIIVIVLLGIGFVAYLFWPEKGYTPSKGYTPPKKEKEEAKDKVKEHYQKLQEKWKNLRKKK